MILGKRLGGEKVLAKPHPSSYRRHRRVLAPPLVVTDFNSDGDVDIVLQTAYGLYLLLRTIVHRLWLCARRGCRARSQAP